jgi:hypothetical protein
MGTKTALEVLVDVTNSDLIAHIPDLAIHFGWRPPVRQQMTTQRVVWTPGDESGSLGKELGATKVPIQVTATQSARNLVDLDEAFHVQLQAFDPSKDKATNERAQYNVCRMLYDTWRACLYRAVHGTHRVGQVHLESARWLLDIGADSRHGAAIVVTGRIRSPIPDDAYGTAFPSTHLIPDPAETLPAPDMTIPALTPP